VKVKVDASSSLVVRNVYIMHAMAVWYGAYILGVCCISAYWGNKKNKFTCVFNYMVNNLHS